MAMYICKTCDSLVDDDYHPMNENQQCPSCNENTCVYCSEEIGNEPCVEEDDDYYHTACYLKEQDDIGHDAEFGGG